MRRPAQRLGQVQVTGRHAGALVVTLVTAAVLALSACGPKAAHPGAGTDNAQVQDMQQKLDAAESAAAEADADSTQDN